MIKYKVVRRPGRDRISSTAKYAAKVKYIPGKWVTAPVGGLFVFRTLKEAKEFHVSGRVEIWKCEVSEPVLLAPYRWGWDGWGLTRVQARWDEGGRDCVGEWPSGTQFYKKVKLLTKVA